MECNTSAQPGARVRNVSTLLLAIAVCATLGTISTPGEQNRATTSAGVPQDPSAPGYLNLHQRHPDATDGQKAFDADYTVRAALQRLGQIQTFLASFKRLTQRARQTLPAEDLIAVGNTSGEMQSIGFHNVPLIVEGTLLKQDYQLTQLEYERAELKFARGEISAADRERAESAYRAATSRFQSFWDKKLPID